MLKASKRVYVWMIVVGIVLTISLVSKIWTGDNIDIIFDIIAMIGSGVLCSAIVALLTEIRNEKMMSMAQQKNRGFVLSVITNGIKGLLILELKYLSAYALLSNTERKETQNCDLAISEIIDKINCILGTITSSIETIYQSSHIPRIDNAYLKRISERSHLAYQCVFPYYENLRNTTQKLLDESNYCLISGILDEDTITFLNAMQQDLSSIIASSDDANLELLFEFKMIFFDNLSKYLDVLGVDKDELLHCYVKEISSNADTIDD